jgi:hypothetical protein
MLENYYEILRISKDAGKFKISFRYLILAKKYLKRKPEVIDEEFLRLNRAFEVLRIPEIRKYYDILLKNFNHHSLDPDDPVTKTYLTILYNQMTKGDAKAAELINNPEFPLKIKLSCSWFLILLNYLFYFNPPAAKIFWTPIAGLIFSIIGAGTIFINNGYCDPKYLAPGIVFFLMGSLIIVFTFRQYIINGMNQ